MYARVIALTLAFLATVSAFAPRMRPMSSMKTSRALKMNFENEIGVLPPVGYWDPLGILCIMYLLFFVFHPL